MDYKNKRKILLVDDDVEVREMYAEILKAADFEIVEAKNGSDGLEKAFVEKPDLVFTGINMPIMDGFTLIEKLKENSATINTPVVISSHMGREEHRIKAKQLGVKDFIVLNNITPRETVERLKFILIGEKEYVVSFDMHAFDAPEFLKNVGADRIIQCPACGGRIVMKISINNFDNESFSAKIACVDCGWKLK